MTLTFIRRLTLLLALIIAGAATSLAQGVQVGTVSGVVQSGDGLPLPGVTVVVASPQLQGERSTITDANGVYYLRGLAAGAYRVSFSISGFRPKTVEGVPVSVGAVAVVNETLALGGVTEFVTVTASGQNAAAGPRTGRTFTKTTVDALPLGRRPVDIAELAPNVTTSAFNANQLVLGGSFGFDNVFMVNGVDVNDNVNGTSNNLFIEDAIQETTVLSHGISAEWGRFSGGVINVVTRSGGNSFSGTFRETLSNPTWIAQTPLERQANILHADVLGKAHEGTFGGPFLRDRLWFFAAGRSETSNTPSTFAQNGGGFTRTDTNRRGEIKLTGAPGAGQSLQASFISNATTQANMSAVGATTLLDASVLTKRDLPNRLFATSYNGALSPRLFATVQYSDKQQEFRNNGGTSSELSRSPIRTAGALPGVPGGLLYNAPYLDATDPEQRDNRQVTGSLSYAFADSRFGTGSHELKGGAEHFISTGIGGNSQSATGAVFVTDYLTSSGAVVRDSAGTPIPVFTPGLTEVWTFRATRGARVDISTSSFFLQDRWVPTRRVTIEAGTRIERVRGAATGGIVPVETWSMVPRLAAAYALDGDGRTVLHATYGHYSGRYGQVQFGVNTSVGRPSEVDYVYAGPAGQGRDFSPGFDLANYQTVTFANFPTSNVRVAGDIHAPVTKEFTLGLGREFGSAQARATYIWRRASDFVEDFATLAGGVTNVELVGALTNRVFDNTSSLARDYQAISLQSGFRVTSRFTVDASYTAQLRNEGAFAGEAANQPGIASIYGNFPEVFGPALDRLLPEGRLDNFQRHKLRVFGTWSQSLGRFGALDVSPLWRVNSGAVYSLTASIPIPAAQLSRNPGYPANDLSAATRETVFFGGRGQYSFKGYGLMDLATTYSVGTWGSLQPWLKVEVFNLFNNQKQIGWDKTIAANRTGPLDTQGIPTTYTQGPRFGQATAGNHFPQPWTGQNGGRATRLLLGVRF